jgi:hypothetical protein
MQMMEDMETRELEARGSGAGAAAAAAQLPTLAACLAAVVGATGVALAPVAPSLLSRFVGCAVATCPKLSSEHRSHTDGHLKCTSDSSQYVTLSEGNWTLQVLATVTAFMDVVRAQSSHISPSLAPLPAFSHGQPKRLDQCQSGTYAGCATARHSTGCTESGNVTGYRHVKERCFFRFKG